MKKTLGLLGALMVAGFGVLAISAPAQATVVDCRTDTVVDRVGPDSGENNNNWATVKLTRKLEVCATSKPDEGNWTYKATVDDNGTFVTLPGDSPGVGTTAKLNGGFNGKVVGGFEATFTAPKWAADWKLVSPPKATSTGNWVATAFPGATFTEAGSVTKWGWTYTTCNGSGEKWVNAESGNSGDITEKVCEATPPKPVVKKCEAYLYTNTTKNLCDRFANRTNQVNCTEVGKWVTLKDYRVDPWGLDGAIGAKYDGVKGIGCEGFQTTPPTTTTPPVAGGNDNGSGGLPVTGAKAGTIFGVGGAVLVIGAIAYVAARKRRDTKFVAE